MIQVSNGMDNFAAIDQEVADATDTLDTSLGKVGTKEKTISINKGREYNEIIVEDVEKVDEALEEVRYGKEYKNG